MIDIIKIVLSVEMKGIKIIKKNANKLRTFLIKNKQLCTEYKVYNDDKYVYMPLINDYDKKIINELSSEFDVKIDNFDFTPAQYRPTNFLDFLDGTISKSLLMLLVMLLYLKFHQNLKIKRKLLVRLYLNLLNVEVFIIKKVKFRALHVLVS